MTTMRKHLPFIMPSVGMATERHVVSFELSVQLKEKGFIQEAEFYWLPATAGNMKGNRRQPHWKGTWNEATRHKVCAAPLLTEILPYLSKDYRSPDEAAKEWLIINAN